MNTIARSSIIGRTDDFSILNRAARLNDGCGAGLCCLQQAIGKGKKGIRRHDRPLTAGSDSPLALAASSLLRTAIRAESTRDICPAPMPDRRAIPWHRRWRSTSRALQPGRQNANRPVPAQSVAAWSRPSDPCHRQLQRHASCTRSPPPTDFTAKPLVPTGAQPRAGASASSFSQQMIASASGSAAGATITSVKSAVISRAVAASSARLKAMMPPKALTGSQLNAFR